MRDDEKTKAELLQEVDALRRRLTEFEQAKVDLKKKGESLEKKGERLRSLLENMPVMIDAFDSTGNIIVWNHECEGVSGYSAEEIIGNPKAMELLYPDATYRERMMREANKRGDKYRHWEGKMICKDGTVKTVLWSNISDQFPIPGWAAWDIGMDITQLKRAGEMLELLGIKFDGREPTETAEGTPGPWDTGQDRFLFSFFRAITRRERAENALRESENKYRTLLENLPQKIFLKDRNSVYVSCNENLAGDLKIKSEEIVGKTDYDFFPKELAEKYRADDKRIMESGGTEDIEEKYIQQGQEIIVHTVKTPVKDAQGNVIGILGIFWDITERKRMEEALRESRRRFRSLVEATSDWVWEIDQNGIYTYSSPKVKDLLGYEPEEIIGKTPFDLMPPDEAERVAGLFKDIVESRQPFNGLENTNLHKDGRNVVLETSGVPIFDEGGNLLGYRGIDRDITERKKAEEEIQ